MTGHCRGPLDGVVFQKVMQGDQRMTVDQVRNVANEQPFRPFVFQLADGRQIPVRHREFMMPSPSGRTVIVYQPDESFNIIDLLLVTDIEVQPEAGAHNR
jgi:hypothetical protein